MSERPSLVVIDGDTYDLSQASDQCLRIIEELKSLDEIVSEKNNDQIEFSFIDKLLAIIQCYRTKQKKRFIKYGFKKLFKSFDLVNIHKLLHKNSNDGHHHKINLD